MDNNSIEINESNLKSKQPATTTTIPLTMRVICELGRVGRRVCITMGEDSTVAWLCCGFNSRNKNALPHLVEHFQALLRPFFDIHCLLEFWLHQVRGWITMKPSLGASSLLFPSSVATE
jgi:hypothetical protein